MIAPKLRFPEFLESGEWKSESLGDVYSFQSTNSFSRDQLNYENGLVKNIHYGDIHTKFATLFDITKENVPFINYSESLNKIALESYCVEGDIVFADASEDMEDVGKSIELVYLNNEKLLAGMHTLLARQKEKKIVVGFGGYLFKSNRIRSQIKKEAQGAKVYGISANRLLNIDICFPADKKEQQKIADCLTSLDELISAERAQLDALKAYKKGLLQNLFPAEGESLPALRFPEFQSAGKWEEAELGNLIDLQSGYAFQSEYFSDKGKKLLTPKNFTQNGYASFNEENTKYTTEETDLKYLCKESDLLLLLTDLTPTCELLGKPLLLTKDDNEVLLNQRIVKVISKGSLEIKFLLYFFLTDSYHQRIKNTATGSTVRHSSNKIIASTKICFPLDKKEQQKIAEMLTSIDEEIAGQGQRAAALQVHKRGLLQGLFPSTGEVEG